MITTVVVAHNEPMRVRVRVEGILDKMFSGISKWRAVHCEPQQQLVIIRVSTVFYSVTCGLLCW
jgi:hypothetical protein